MGEISSDRVEASAQLEARVFEVFHDVDKHRQVAEIVRHHSLNPVNIHRMALSEVDFSGVSDILDLGCGFGSFVSALPEQTKEIVRLTGLDIIPACEQTYLEACRTAGISGRFISQGVSWLSSVRTPSFDLILSSYSLYFFPGALSDITRSLRAGGVFIAITHDCRNLDLLARLVREFLASHGQLHRGELPVETMINRFCAENGDALLRGFFSDVRFCDYTNTLFFSPDDVEALKTYFYFRSPFYLMGTSFSPDELVPSICSALEKESIQHNGVRLSKNDRIFICRKSG